MGVHRAELVGLLKAAPGEFSNYFKNMMEDETRQIFGLEVRTPEDKYGVLEAFVGNEVFQKQPVRMSYFAELMDRMNLGAYRNAIEKQFFKDADRKPKT